MASNCLEDLNNMLFNQLVRLDKDEISPEELEKETMRAGAMTSVGKTILENASIQLKASEFYDHREDSGTKLPKVFKDGARKK